MILTAKADPVAVWWEAERYLGAGTRTYSSFSADLDVDEAYHPQRGGPSFAVPTFWVPDDEGSYLRNDVDSELHRLYRRDGEFLLPVHPQTLAMLAEEVVGRLRHLEPGPPLTVVPSANVRTVFVLGHGPGHFVKLHYPRRLSRFTRRLRRPIISVQLWVSNELQRIGAPYLPEVGAGVFGTDLTHAWGFLLREQRLTHGGRRFTVPMFALYGSDIRAPDDPTLVEQLIAAASEDPAEFLTERVVRPMVRLWVRTAVSTGCALEMHGQNTLFSFDLDGQSTVGYRDCGVYVDPVARSSQGLPPDDLPPINVMERDISFPRRNVFSLAYDSFLGHHTLAFLARVGEKAFGVPPAVLQDAAREEFAAVPAAASLLPPTVAYYDDQLHDDGGWRLVDTGAAPDWR